MPPLPHPLHATQLTLTFPTLSSLTSTSHLAQIATLARASTSLTLLVQLAFPFPFHPPSTSSTSQASAISLPTYSNFHALQNLISELYATATKVFIEDGRPLAKADVVLLGMRELAWCDDKTGEVEIVKIEVGEEEGVREKRDDEGMGEERFYEVTALGGTFDHLHAGHKVLLTMAAFITTRRLIVGISG